MATANTEQEVLIFISIYNLRQFGLRIFMIVLPPVLMVNDERDLLWLLMEWPRRTSCYTPFGL